MLDPPTAARGTRVAPGAGTVGANTIALLVRCASPDIGNPVPVQIPMSSPLNRDGFTGAPAWLRA